MTIELVDKEDVRTNKKSEKTENTDNKINDNTVDDWDIIHNIDNNNDTNLPMLEEKPGDNIDIIANLGVVIMKVNNKEIKANDFIIYSRLRGKDAKYIADKLSHASGVKVTALDVVKYYEKKETDFTDLVKQAELDLESELLDEDSEISEKIVRTDVLGSDRFLNRQLKGLESDIEVCEENGDMKTAGTLRLKSAELHLKIKQAFGRLETPVKVKIDARTMNVMTFMKDIAKLKYADGSIDKAEKKAKKEGIIDTQVPIDVAWSETKYETK